MISSRPRPKRRPGFAGLIKKNLPKGKIVTGGFLQDGGEIGGLALQG
jgi:hypothetical protein